MVEQTKSQSSAEDSLESAPWAPLEESAETFRRECEALDQLVEELFGELEAMNLRLGHKSAEIAQQQQYIEQREQQWLQRQNEQEDIREFFVHQNNQLNEAVEKLAAFETKLNAEQGDSPVHEKIEGLLSEIRSEREELRESRQSDHAKREQLDQQWQQYFDQQREQLGQALEQLAAFESQLTQLAGAESSAAPSAELTQLIEEVRGQHQWLREQAEAEASAPAAEGDDLKPLLTRQEEQLTQTLEKLSQFEQQLSELAAAGTTRNDDAPDWSELLTQLQAQREELREQTELTRTTRQQDHESLEAFFARQGDQLEGALGKFNAFEGLVKDLVSADRPAAEQGDNSLTELQQELRSEREEFRQRFEQAHEEAARLEELMAGLAQRGGPAADAEGDGDQGQLAQELAAANQRVAELEQLVNQQQQELREEKQELREQLRELRELLELRSGWDAPAAPADAPAQPPANQPPANQPPADQRSQTISLEPAAKHEPDKKDQAAEAKQAPDSEKQSVLAQFAKLSRK